MFICHLPGALFADLVRVGTVVKRIRAADLANRAEERVSALRSKGGNGRRSCSGGRWFLAVSKLCLRILEGLNRWAFSKTPNFSDPIDNDFAALGFIGRANLVATFVWVRLGIGVDRDAESEDDDGVVKEHIEDWSSSCGRDADMDEK